MEQQQQPQAPNDQQHGSSNSTSGKSSNTRWAPTTEQIRILKELYYNNGVRSPSTEQIQRIAAKLRRYGKVEGKNVFYWFQNHKARERQKNRFTITDPHKSSFHKKHQNNFTAALHNVGGVSSSSSGVVGVGQMGGFGSYGPVNMEMNFRDCSISSAGGSNGLNGGASIMSNNNNNNSNSWFRIDPYSSSHVNLFSLRSKSVKESFEFNRRYHHQEEDEDDGGGGDPTAQIETLPLFPMHGEDIIHGFDDIDSESDGGCCIGSGRTPPELSLFPFNC